ncbi:MAG: tetratricopeptide repeat protein, partial [Myxococcota bacterium]
MTLPDVFVLLLLGTAHAGDPRSDLAAAAAAVRAHPEDVAAQELYLDLLVGTGRTGVALEAARARLAAAPRDPDANYLVGRATMDPAAAQLAFEAALRLDPDHARASMGLASVAEARGRLADAEAGYSRAAGRDPALVEAWVGWV